MKNNIRVTAAAALIMAAVPFAAVYGKDMSCVQEDESVVSEAERESAAEDENGKKEYTLPFGKTISVYLTSENRIISVSERDYVIGAVFAEMPADYPMEALKAQAAAARTYSLRRRLCGSGLPDDADIADDPQRYQMYLTPDEARALSGDKYEEYLARISEAADSTENAAVFFEDMPIVAAFHPLSAGMTESSENVWGTELPYLVPADSSFDKGSPDYISEYTFTYAELAARFSAAYPDISFDVENILPEVTERSGSGTVMSVSVCGNEFGGIETAELLSLPSAVFEISRKDDSAVFSVRGIGHGVGMSQYGAKRMAEEGADYEEILKHYYSGAEIVSVKYSGDQSS